MMKEKMYLWSVCVCVRAYACIIYTYTHKLSLSLSLSHTHMYISYRISKTCDERKDVFLFCKIEKNFNSLKKEYLIATAVTSVKNISKQ